jgi:cell filamentation protein
MYTPIKTHIKNNIHTNTYTQNTITKQLRIEPPCSKALINIQDSLPKYKQNPKFITYQNPKNKEETIFRWPQLGDTVGINESIKTGYCIGEILQNNTLLCRVALSNGSEQIYDAKQLSVIRSNIEGLCLIDTENILYHNRLHIKSLEELNYITSHKNRSIQELANQYTRPSEQLILALHDHIFGDVFYWAGDYRDVDLSVGTNNYPTPNPDQVEVLFTKLMDKITTQFENIITKTEPTNKSAYWLTLAQIYYEFCYIHPFRDGNGRISRALLSWILTHTPNSSVGTPVLMWDQMKRPGNKTDRAFDAARQRSQLKPLAALIYKAWFRGERAQGAQIVPLKCFENYVGAQRSESGALG